MKNIIFVLGLILLAGSARAADSKSAPPRALGTHGKQGGGGGTGVGGGAGACAADVDKLCAEERAKGRFDEHACLQKHAKELSKPCAKRLKAIAAKDKKVKKAAKPVVPPNGAPPPGDNK